MSTIRDLVVPVASGARVRASAQGRRLPLPFGVLSLRSGSSRRPCQLLSSLVATAVALAGFTSSSCASPRLPGGGLPLRVAVGGYELQVLVNGAPAPTFENRGESYVLGQLGARYTLRVINHTGRRIEAVASVDGRDAIDGKTADVRNKRGYMVPAWGTVDIDGWRLSQSEAAAFRFSSVADSYAARTGSARDVGVIGVAVFPERYAPPPRPVYAPPDRQTSPAWPGLPGWSERNEDARGLGSPPPTGSGGGRVDREAARSVDDFASESASGSASSKRSIGADLSEPPAPSASADNGLSKSESAPAPHMRRGLGTEFGEAVSSPVQEVSFVRANAGHPSVILGARYNDRDGLLALGIQVDACCDSGDDLAWRQSAIPFPASEHRYAAPPAGWHPGCCMRY